jgi:hypothetical protein
MSHNSPVPGGDFDAIADQPPHPSPDQAIRVQLQNPANRRERDEVLPRGSSPASN